MPEGAGAMSASLEEHLFGEVPDILRTPEICEQLAKWQGGHQLLQPFLGQRIGIVHMRLLLGSTEHPGSVRTVVFHGPVESRPAALQLLLVQETLDQDRPVFQKGLA
ncbi:hypothetical protein D9M68_738960 [compost metagenome]